MPTLDSLPAGTRAIVTAVNATGEIHQRLCEMGLLEDCEIEVVRFAPLGDPMEIRLRGYNLSLRKAEARTVTVETRS